MTNEELLEKLRKELLLSRILNGITCVLMLLLLVGGFLFYQKTQESQRQLQSYVEDVQEHSEVIEAAITQLALLDMEVLNETMGEALGVLREVDWKMISESIESVDWEMLSNSIESVDWESVSNSIESVDWENLSKQLNELDVESINEAVEGLDTEEVTQALETLNNSVDKLKKAADALSKMGDKVSGLGDKIGGYFKNDKD